MSCYSLKSNINCIVNGEDGLCKVRLNEEQNVAKRMYCTIKVPSNFGMVITHQNVIKDGWSPDQKPP